MGVSLRMQASTSTHSPGLPPLVGTHVVVFSQGLERAHDRARGLEEFGYRVFPFGEARTALDYASQGKHFGKVCIDLMS